MKKITNPQELLTLASVDGKKYQLVTYINGNYAVLDENEHTYFIELLNSGNSQTARKKSKMSEEEAIELEKNSAFHLLVKDHYEIKLCEDRFSKAFLLKQCDRILRGELDANRLPTIKFLIERCDLLESAKNEHRTLEAVIK